MDIVTTVSRNYADKEYMFSSSHILPNEMLHGHDYFISIVITAKDLIDSFVFDHRSLRKFILEICQQFHNKVIVSEYSEDFPATIHGNHVVISSE